jgi:hypothetical protein
VSTESRPASLTEYLTNGDFVEAAFEKSDRGHTTNVERKHAALLLDEPEKIQSANPYRVPYVSEVPDRGTHEVCTTLSTSRPAVLIKDMTSGEDTKIYMIDRRVEESVSLRRVYHGQLFTQDAQLVEERVASPVSNGAAEASRASTAAKHQNAPGRVVKDELTRQRGPG